jgi:transcription elongation factor/antiterminator RfaH
MMNWFLLYTKARCEDMVADRLSGDGFDVLNPKISERRYMRRRLTDTVSPLFPCYLFVRFDNSRDSRLIRYTRGVKRIVGVEHAPSVVPDGIIDDIAARLKGGPITARRRSFMRGDAVSIKGGPFEGFSAIFEAELRGQDRVLILLNAMNARAIVDPAMIERAPIPKLECA